MSTLDSALTEAFRKKSQGRGLKNSEIRLLNDYAKGRLQPSEQRSENRTSEGSTRTDIEVGRDTLYKGDVSSSYVEGSAVEVVGADGKLVRVVRHSSWTPPVNYPTVLKTVNGGVTAKLDGDGIQVFNSSYLIEMNPSGAAVVFRNNAGPYSITFNLAALAQDLGLRVEDYCDAGVNKSQTHLASAPYV